jgi:broad specificity phosphatase PhoE
VDSKKYCHTADPKIRLTERGAREAESCGQEVRRIIEQENKDGDWLVHFYVSPYTRALSTLKQIGRAFDKEHIVGVREEPRIREQDFGNFQNDDMKQVFMPIRERFGRFFYRFPEGESAADVFDRVTSFLESLWRDIDMNRLTKPANTKQPEVNLVIVSHGVTMRVFLMRWFKWTVEQFEKLNNPKNCEVRVMQLSKGGEYSLLVHHSPEELREWGLSDDMIKDQECRRDGIRGLWSEKWNWGGAHFFDNEEDDQEYAKEYPNGNGNCGDNLEIDDNTQTPLDVVGT